MNGLPKSVSNGANSENRNNNANGNGNGNGNGAINLSCLPSLCRGIYNRVAQKLGCDPSYVSRVARGERNSQEVSDALRAEVQQTWALANGKLTHLAPRPRTNKRKPRSASLGRR